MRRYMVVVALVIALALVLGPVAQAYAAGAWVPAVRPERECRMVQVWHPVSGGWAVQVRLVWLWRLVWVWRLEPGR